MTKVCECCGHPLPDKAVFEVLTPMQRRIFQAVAAAGTHGITSRVLIDRLYQDDPNGGPSSINIIAVVASHMRPRLKPFGITLKANPGREGRYTLQKLEEVNVADR